MGTRSSIAIKHNNVVRAIYCHWDGYLEHNGYILHQHYQNSVKVNRLISLGHLSVLGEEIGEEIGDGLGKDDPVTESWCIFYGRDRGESGTEFTNFNSEEDWVANMESRGCEYFYLYDSGVWYVSQDGVEGNPLHEVLDELDCSKEAA